MNVSAVCVYISYIQNTHLYTYTLWSAFIYALVHKVYTIIRKLHFGILVEQEAASTVIPSSSPTQQSDTGALIGVSVALAVLMASLVGACVPVIVCIYFRNRHSKKQIEER